MYGQIIHRISDDSYVIMKNGMPYHVTNEGIYADEYNEVRTYADTHPDIVKDEQPYVSTIKELAENVRSERDMRITATDYLVMPDYPLDTEKLEEIKVYRQALRDLPQQPGFPWNGPDDPECPWPVEP